MFSAKCPGQDTRYWKAEDIHEQECPYCGSLIEFWKTDVRVRCPNCKRKVANPRFNLGCAQWCAYADKCLGGAGPGAGGGTLRSVLESRLTQMLQKEPQRAGEIRAQMDRVEAESIARQVDPLPALIAVIAREVFPPEQAGEIEIFFNELVEQHDFPPEAVDKARQII